MENNSARYYGSLINQWLTNPWVCLLLRIFLGILFIYAGWLKLFDMHAFMKDIGHYRLLPHILLPVTAIILPAIEIVTGLCLILGLFFDGALAITTGLIVVFLIAIESALLRKLDIYCGCFGTSDAELIGINVLLRDFILFVCTIPLWMVKDPVFTADKIINLRKN